MRYSALSELAKNGTRKLKAPRDEALAVAQRNAALPVDRGGLGLGPNNTPMERARAMGYQSGWYHSSPVEDVEELAKEFAAGDPNKRANYNGLFISNNKDKASQSALSSGMDEPHEMLVKGNYLDTDTESHDLKRLARSMYKYDSDLMRSIENAGVPESGQPKDILRGMMNDDLLSDSNGMLQSTQSLDLAERLGFSGLDAYSPSLGGGTTRMVADPANVRSRFAAFDPSRRNESDLLAGIAPYALPAAGAAGLAAMAMPGESEASQIDPLSELEIARRRKLANIQAMTHQAPREQSNVERFGREILGESFNPANWLPLGMFAREMGRPEDLRMVNGEWVTQ